MHSVVMSRLCGSCMLLKISFVCEILHPPSLHELIMSLCQTSPGAIEQCVQASSGNALNRVCRGEPINRMYSSETGSWLDSFTSLLSDDDAYDHVCLVLSIADYPGDQSSTFQFTPSKTLRTSGPATTSSCLSASSPKDRRHWGPPPQMHTCPLVLGRACAQWVYLTSKNPWVVRKFESSTINIYSFSYKTRNWSN